MITAKGLELLQFRRITSLLSEYCHSAAARSACHSILPSANAAEVIPRLKTLQEMVVWKRGGNFFPSIDHVEVGHIVATLSVKGASLLGQELVSLASTITVANTLSRFLAEKRSALPLLSDLAVHRPPCPEATRIISAVVDADGHVIDAASPELQRLRRAVASKRRESDRLFYQQVSALRKQGMLRDNEEAFYNGRRTMAVQAEFKSEISGLIHGKSESGRTLFIEPAATVSVNQEIAELEIDEQREVTRILRDVCSQLAGLLPELKLLVELLEEIDVLSAKASLALRMNATLPHVNHAFEVHYRNAFHPLLLLQNTAAGKPTVPLSFDLDARHRIIVISGPNAGGKTIALKTVGLMQLMIQSGLLVPMDESSSVCFFDELLVDIGDSQSIENELSTYSGKLRAMNAILDNAGESTLVLMDEFGSGTDPELGAVIAEAVLESLVTSQTRGIITSHFGNIKVLAGKLDGAVNASMLFDAERLEPRYTLSVGEPGSSYTFEVAERTGFPKHLVDRARKKLGAEKVRLDRLLAEVQDQKSKLAQQIEHAGHEEFLARIEKEKYKALFEKWREKIEAERERKIELARLAEFGQKYLRLLDEWNERKDRKDVIRRFIDGITAETRKQEALSKMKKLDRYSRQRVERLKPQLKIGSLVRLLKGTEVGVVEDIREEKVVIRFGNLRMTAGMESLALADS